MRTRVSKMLLKIIPSLTPYSQRLPPSFQAPSCQKKQRPRLEGAGAPARPTRGRTPESSLPLTRARRWDDETSRERLSRKLVPTLRGRQGWGGGVRPATHGLGGRCSEGNPPGFQNRARSAPTSIANYGAAQRTYQAGFAVLVLSSPSTVHRPTLLPSRGTLKPN